MASTALASPALAKDDSWYIGAEFGSMLVEDGGVKVLHAEESPGECGISAGEGLLEAI